MSITIPETVNFYVDTPEEEVVDGYNGNEPSFRWGTQERIDPEDLESVIKRSERMFEVMQSDRKALDHFAEYGRGNQLEPFVPEYASQMAKELAPRSVTNLMPLAVNIPAQISFIDGYSRKGDFEPPEWKVWRKSNMAAKQTRCFIASLTYGYGFTMLSNIGTDDRRIDLLSTRDTVAFFEDSINDVTPVWGLTIKSYPKDEELPGRAIYMDAEKVVHLDFDGAAFEIADNGVQEHNLGMTPLVRWPAIVDDRGHARGVIEDLIPSQDRVNQSVYDLLVDQSFGAYKVRTAAGLVGEPLFHEDGSPRLDANGEQVYGPVQISQGRFLATDDPDAKFGTLDETPLDGFIAAVGDSIKSFAVVGQLPPHSLLGSMSNLSAETLQALMAQTTRFTSMLQASWADACRTQLRMIAKDIGDEAGVDPEDDEVRWRDMDEVTFGALVDALGKASQMLGVPGRGLWSRIPGATDAEIAKWDDLKEQEVQQGLVEEADSPEAAFNREAAKPPVEEPAAGALPAQNQEPKELML